MASSVHSSTTESQTITGGSKDASEVALRRWRQSKDGACQRLGSLNFELLKQSLSSRPKVSEKAFEGQILNQPKNDIFADWQHYVGSMLHVTQLEGLAGIPGAEDLDLCANGLCYFQKVIHDYGFDDLLRRSPAKDQLNALNDHILDIETYASSIAQVNSNNPSMLAAIIEIAACYLTLYVDLVQFVKSHQSSVNCALSEWDQQAGPLVLNLSSRIERQKELLKDANASQTLRPQDSLGSQDSAFKESTKPNQERHHYLPLPKVPAFFGRDKQHQALHFELDHDPNDMRHRTVCICGAGGIGKTQLALEYAYSQKERLNFILWINSENQIEIDRSFSAIALELELTEGDEGRRQAHNRKLVLDYLQHSDEDFLVIFDNVENFDDIRTRCWPLSPRASVLVTARQEIFAVDMVRCIEVPSLDYAEGVELLLSTVAKASYSISDKDAAKKLAEALDGMPLALTIMATNIRSSKKSLTNFLPWYNDNIFKIHKKASKTSLQPYYPHNLSDCYKTSFTRLRDENENAYELFRIVCTLGAEALPSSLFSGQGRENLPTGLRFCHEEWEFQEAIEALTELALIRVDDEDDSMRIFVHRVIQVEFNNTLASDQLQENFLSAGKLLFQMFPKLVNGLSFRKVWKDCARLAGHVSALCRHSCAGLYKLELGPDVDDIVHCLASCAWYLREISNFSGCLDTLDVAFKLCSDKNTLLYANLLNTAGIIATRQNRIQDGYRYHRECLEIRKALLKADHEEIANCHNNIGNTYLSDCLYDDAIIAYEEAIRIDNLQPEAEARLILNIRYSNIAEAYMMKGDYTQMEQYLKESRELAIDEFGKNTFYDADVDWILGHKFYHHRDLETARELYTRAYQVNREENPDSMTSTAILYKLGSISLELGEIDKSITQLRSALQRAHANKEEQGNDGEIARVKRRLADALRQAGTFGDEAIQLHQEAESSRLFIQSNNGDILRDTESSYDLLVACYYRGWHLAERDNPSRK